ncbi:hypothetical protein [Cetobacterium sp. SF1]|uniref:hypothetical protein n=1 Tax=unclassified Cetobacterium TaxID=2630983 RepID=UPI003CF14ED4
MLRKLRKHMGDKLDIFIYGSQLKYKILILGCEEEDFIKKLFKRFPNSNMDIMDKDFTNILYISSIIGVNENVNYIHGDIEFEELQDKYDLIFSNGNFHLIDDFQELLNKFYNGLNYSGKIIFSTIIESIYKNNINENFIAHKYLYPEEIKDCIEGRYRVLIIDEEIIREPNTFSADLIYMVLEKVYKKSYL